MQIVLIVIYCLMAAFILFGLTFQDEMASERRRKEKLAKPLTVDHNGKASLRPRA